MRHRANRRWNRRTAISLSVAGITSMALVGAAVAVHHHGSDEHKSSAKGADRHTRADGGQGASSRSPDGESPEAQASRRSSEAKRSRSSASPAPTASAAAGAEATKSAEPEQKCGEGAFDAEAVKTGDTWTSRNGDKVVYEGDDMTGAIVAALASLDPERTAKERVVVRGSGTMPANWKIKMPNHTALDVCGTITATGDGATDTAPIYARAVTDVEIQHLKITGSPMYGIFMRSVENITLGQVEINGTYIGVRIDNFGDRTRPTKNIRIDNIKVTGSGSQAVETYGVDGLTIGKVTARNVGESGLLLNGTTNAEIGTVDAVDAGTGTGYAAFRMANRNGRIGDSYKTNIHVGKVIARGGGRGIFCVSESGGAVIDEVDIADTGNHAILVENCYNVTIGAKGGTVAGPGHVRLAARAEFANSRDITLENLTVRDTVVEETPCADNSTFKNLKRDDTALDVC
ncbi:putative low-complexity protein [Streptomyces sp. 3330]|uniref:right-handed parallel beta-helix repeat-containing protein n=1 Tax=Streptomyces sp. 3330 TaxID=2817755 RepID=UPI002864AA09|nr:right-handed parallel beta-helix repeat-containing protein [Streptomyces sp. 3330]MDR6976067.1 putative low-complexity protein [Streptomyces sp. 3330]